MLKIEKYKSRARTYNFDVVWTMDRVEQQDA